MYPLCGRWWKISLWTDIAKYLTLEQHQLKEDNTDFSLLDSLVRIIVNNIGTFSYLSFCMLFWNCFESQHHNACTMLLWIKANSILHVEWFVTMLCIILSLLSIPSVNWSHTAVNRKKCKRQCKLLKGSTLDYLYLYIMLLNYGISYCVY